MTTTTDRMSVQNESVNYKGTKMKIKFTTIRNRRTGGRHYNVKVTDTEGTRIYTFRNYALATRFYKSFQ